MSKNIELTLNDHNPISFWSEKVTGAGEDAFPVTLLSQDLRFGLAAVFDGLGGAGAGRFELPNGSFTGARIAARIAQSSFIETVYRIWLNTPYHNELQTIKKNGLTYEEHKSGLADTASEGALATKFRKRGFEEAAYLPPGLLSDKPPMDWASELRGIPNPPLSAFDSFSLGCSFDRTFTDTMRQLSGHASNSRIKTRGKRHLPTTFAAGFFAEHAGKVTLKVFWAGDSRIYLLCSRGLFQLSTDHAQLGADPSGDAPLTRVISEQAPNEIDSHQVAEILPPGYLIACTDGAYAYFPTAVHFELALWSALEKKTNEERETDLGNSIADVAQDDASIAIVPIGFDGTHRPIMKKDLTDLHRRRQYFEDRIRDLREAKAHVAKLDAEVEEMRAAMQALPRATLAGGEEIAS
jgi:serine/threonine protein phosphatase PrpC